MAKLDTRIIPLDELFAPVISDGQIITCYLDEEMTPYAIQGDNINVVIDKSGSLSALNTNTKSSLVSAVNEVKSSVGTNASNIGTLSNLGTTEKGSLVGAVNEINTNTKITSPTDGNVVTMDTNGKLTNSGIASADIVTKITGTVTTGGIPTITADGKLQNNTTLLTDVVTKVTSATNGNLAGLDANGKLIDSGVASSVIGILTSLDTTAKTSLVAAINEIFGFTKVLKESSGAGLHNNLYRGKSLGAALTDAQSAAIRAGTFDDMFIGDYWSMTVNYTYYVATSDSTAQSGKTYYANVNGTALSTQPEVGTDISGLGYYEAVSASATVNFRIAGFDYYLKSGDQNNGLATHHAVIVPDTSLYKARMNAENITTGGYVGSEMYTKNLARAKALITAAFGSGHILTHREYLQNAVTSGRPSGGAWCNSTIELMTEQMVYGGKVFGVASDGGDTVPNLYTVSKSQLPLFSLRPDMIIAGSGSNRAWYWLRDVVNGLCFARVDRDGDANFQDASNSGGGVRPAALIY